MKLIRKRAKVSYLFEERAAVFKKNNTNTITKYLIWLSYSTRLQEIGSQTVMALFSICSPNFPHWYSYSTALTDKKSSSMRKKVCPINVGIAKDQQA